MTNPRTGNGLSETCKTNLLDIYLSAKYKRKEFKTSKFLDKGNEREEDSITALARVKKKMLKKNEIELSNRFIKGTPDIYEGESIHNAEETTDTKTSWSLHTFFRAQKEEVDKMYYWQGQGYMALTGAKKHHVVYCLVNGTINALMDEKRRAAWKYGVIDPSASPHPEYVKMVKQIEINHIFDAGAFKKEYPGYEWENEIWEYDIPLEDRVYIVTVERDQAAINSLYERVIQCREWMEDNLFKNELQAVS